MATVSKTAGSLYYIGPVVDVEAIENMTDGDAVTYFEGLSWTEIEEVESVGEFGDTSETTSFASIKDRRAQTFKTLRDGGTLAMVCGRAVGDPGQAAVIAAEKTDYSYAFKVVYSDSISGDFTNSVEYFGGLVISRPTNLGGVGDVTKRTFNIKIQTAVYAVDSESEVVPTNSVLPSIIGASVQVGVTLTAIEGEWTGNPTSYAYQWQHDTSGNGTFANVAAGGTSKTYVPVVGDIADSLRVQVTATNGAGASAAANSLGTIPIIAA